jgi:hypothetical protein
MVVNEWIMKIRKNSNLFFIGDKYNRFKIVANFC